MRGPRTVEDMRPPARARTLLTALVVAVVQVGASFGAAQGQPDRRGIDLLAVGILLLGPAALTLRERVPLVASAVPVAAALVFIGAGYPFGPVFLSIVVGLYWAIQDGRRWTAYLLAGAGYAGIWVAVAIDDRTGHTGPLHYGLVAGWVLVVLTGSEIARAVRAQAAERARAAEEDRRRRESEQRLAVAQELHDVLAHTISLINVQSSVALHLLDTQPEQAASALTAIKAASQDALQGLRSALDLLRHGEAAAPLAPAPTLAGLDDLAAAVRAGGLEVGLEVDGALDGLPPAVEAAAYRIVQEALTNVTRHARATRAEVRVRIDDAVAVEVVDDGVGGALVPGTGITGMRERARALGGDLEAGPSPGGGFAVRGRLPLGGAPA